MPFSSAQRYIAPRRRNVTLLICRCQIRGAIQEYQTQLIESVKEDIQRLHHKVRFHCDNSVLVVALKACTVQDTISLLGSIPHVTNA